MPITQAGKTIIFEEFSYERNYNNDEIPDNLEAMLSSAPKQSDLVNIEEKLGVSSYPEFLSKFQPVIYEQQLSADDETGQKNTVFVYSLEKPEGDYNIINIKNEKFYQMAVRLYDRKCASGLSNLSFDYESIQEVLTPKDALASARKLRRELEYNMNELGKIGEKSPYQANKHKKRIIELRKEIIDKFYKRNVLTMLPLAIDDAQRKIDFIDKSQKTLQDNTGTDSKSVKLLPCSISFDDDGGIKIETKQISELHNKDVERLTTSQQKLIGFIEKDFDKYGSDEMKKTDFSKKLMVSTFTGGVLSVSSEEREKYVRNRDNYARIYKSAQEAFAKQMIALVEKFINVRAFFDNASDSDDKTLPFKVIIANSKISSFMQPGKKENFKRFIDLLGQQNTDEKLWYAVVPAVMDSDFADDEDIDIDIDDDMDFGFDDDSKNKSENKEGLSTFSEFKQFIQILRDAKIVTFFNFKANEKTSFSEFNEEIIGKYKEKCNQIDNDLREYVVLSYPNFTLLPKSRTRSVFCKITEEGFDENNISCTKEVDCYLDSPSIYLDSSYIACAMMIKAHDSKCLASKGFQVSGDGTPAVRFDFEGSFYNKTFKQIVDCNKILTTNLNRESVYSDSKTEKAVDNFGFCFGCNEIRGADPKSNDVVKNTYVVCARTVAMEMAKGDSQESHYRPLYKTVVKTFMSMYYNFSGDTIFSRDIKKWRTEASKKNADNLFYEGDIVDDPVKNDEGKLEITVNYADNSSPDGIVFND